MFGNIIKHTTDLYALCLYAPFVIRLRDAGKKEQNTYSPIELK